MNRKEHVEWCKKRALEYLDRGDIKNAITSMISDMRKHPGVDKEFINMMSSLALFELLNPSDGSARRFITGFN